MTQLEEFMEAREELQAKQRMLLDTSKNAVDKAEHARALQQYNRNLNLIADLDVQIRHLDPTALKPKRHVRSRGLGGHRVFLDAIPRPGIHGRGTPIAALVGAEDTYNLDPESPIVQWMQEAAAQLTPLQAKCIDLYYNKGYSYAKCAEILGKGVWLEIRQSAKRGLKCIQYWVRIRRIVTVCAMETPFNWDRFLTELDILKEKQLDIFLTLLDSKPEEFPTCYGFARYVGIHEGSAYRDIQRIKSILCAIGIPREEVEAVHPLLKRVGNPQPRPKLVHWLCRAGGLKKFSATKKEDTHVGS